MTTAPDLGISAPASTGFVDVAALLLAAGRQGEAEEIYRRIFAAQARHLDSHDLLSMLPAQQAARTP